MYIKNNQPLENDQLKKIAPSIFAEEPHGSRSNKYVYIPTINIIEKLRNEGFLPFSVSQARTKDLNDKFYTKHLIRLRRLQDIKTIHDDVNEIILINSHNGACSYQMLSGAFRFACANGLIIGTADQEIKVRHQGNQIVDDIIEGVYRVVEQFEEIAEEKKEIKSLILNNDEKNIFAETVLDYRYEDKHCPITADQLLKPRRTEDNNNDLWTTFNVVQENIIKGGLYGINQKMKFVKTRKIQGIDSSVKFNKFLWELTKRMKEIKTGTL